MHGFCRHTTHFSLSCCPSVPEDEYTPAPSCWEEGGGCWLGCLRRELWQSQVLGSTEHARPVPVKRTVVQAQPGLASPCVVSAESFLPSPLSSCPGSCGGRAAVSGEVTLLHSTTRAAPCSHCSPFWHSLAGAQVPSFLLPSPHCAPHARASNPPRISQ